MLGTAVATDGTDQFLYALALFATYQIVSYFAFEFDKSTM